MSTSTIGTIFPAVPGSALVKVGIPQAGGFTMEDGLVPVESLTGGLVNYSIDITNAQLLTLSGSPLVVFPATPGKAFFPIAAYLQIGGTEALTGVLSASILNSGGSTVATCYDTTFATPGYVSSFAIAIGAVEPNDLGAHLQFGDALFLSTDADGGAANGNARLTMSGYIVSQI